MTSEIKDEWSQIDDQWGGIDEKMLLVVRALNGLGVVTDGSCEGHVDRGGAAPYVSVFQLDENNNLREKETQEMFAKLGLLVDEFNKTRHTSEEVKIRAEAPAFFHNGVTLWKKWREEVQARRKVQIEGGVPVRPTLTAEEIQAREAILPELQNEFRDFADFLEGK